MHCRRSDANSNTKYNRPGLRDTSRSFAVFGSAAFSTAISRMAVDMPSTSRSIRLMAPGARPCRSPEQRHTLCQGRILKGIPLVKFRASSRTDMPKFSVGHDPMRGAFEPKLVSQVQLSRICWVAIFLAAYGATSKIKETHKLQHVLDEQKLGPQLRGKPTRPQPAAFVNHPRAAEGQVVVVIRQLRFDLAKCPTMTNQNSAELGWPLTSCKKIHFCRCPHHSDHEC